MRALALTLVFAASLAGFLAAGAPMATALRLAGAADRGLYYADARGTIWDGEVRDVYVAGQRVGDVRLMFAPAALLRGELGMDFAAHGAVRAHGEVRAGLGGALSLSDATLVVDARDLSRLHPEIKARGGELFVRLDEFVFDRERSCVRATGAVQSDVLARGGSASGWRGPPLAGDVACDDGALVFALSGEESGTDVRVDARLSPRTGAREVLADVSTENPNVVAALLYFGFEESGDGFTYAYARGAQFGTADSRSVGGAR